MRELGRNTGFSFFVAKTNVEPETLRLQIEKERRTQKRVLWQNRVWSISLIRLFYAYIMITMVT
jgi:hypothetical protein